MTDRCVDDSLDMMLPASPSEHVRGTFVSRQVAAPSLSPVADVDNGLREARPSPLLVLPHKDRDRARIEEFFDA